MAKSTKAPQCKYMPAPKNTIIIHSTKSGKEYSAGFTIGVQYFCVGKRETKAEAKFMCDMLEKAFNALNLPPWIDNIKSPEVQKIVSKDIYIKVLNKG